MVHDDVNSDFLFFEEEGKRALCWLFETRGSSLEKQGEIGSYADPKVLRDKERSTVRTGFMD